jgi:DtxR family Mn-dependent transcriptional regulator
MTFLGNLLKIHRDPIPNAKGEIFKIDKQLLSELGRKSKGICESRTPLPIF